MQLKTTRAFRTISEAGEELDLQPHVLRFWESKFPQIKPMKRGGGRRFYRPEDIEFLRGIKILLHDEKHPIKDVQKLIRVKGAGRVMELGRSIERAAKPKSVEDVELIPDRIANYEAEDASRDDEILRPISPPSVVTAKAPNSDGAKIAPVIHSVEIEEEVVVPPVEEELPEVEYEYVEEEISLAEVRADDLVIDEPAIVEDEAAKEASSIDITALEDALSRLTALRGRWDTFKASAPQ